MSDITLMAERIRETMGALEEAQRAGEELRQRANHENYIAFRRQMDALAEHLVRLRAMLKHESDVALGELADALAVAFYAPPAEYHHLEQFMEENEETQP